MPSATVAPELTGRITEEGTRGRGVPGLLAEVWVGDEHGSQKAGSAYTDAEGNFSVQLADPALVERRPVSAEVVVSDRDGVLIHRQSLRTLAPGRRGLRIRVASAALTRHYAEPLLLGPDPSGGPIDVEGLVASVTDMLRAGLPSARPELIEQLTLGVRCPLPSTQLLGGLEREAFGVLAGDPRAVDVFVTLLDELDPLPPRPSAPLPRAMRSEAGGCGCGGTRSREGFGFEGSPIAGEETFLSAERALPMIAAAAHLQVTGLFGDDLISRVLRPLCGIEWIGKLHRLGVEASGSQEALGQRLGALLSPLAPFPECPPPRFPDLNLHLTCEKWVGCGNTALEAFSGARAYVITGVSRAVACPGDVITITGAGFGTTPGQVSFGGVLATATTWTDTSITVTVPPGARNPLSLVLPKYMRLVCNRLVEATPIGSITANFEVGVPEIQAFFIDSPWNRPYCVEPGAPIRLTWRVRGTTNVRVEILDPAGQVIAVSDPAPRHGIFAQVTAPATNQTLRLRARIVASGQCGPDAVDEFEIYVTRKPLLRIDGLEITQAIQHYRANLHLNDPADRGPDNSLRLVTNKTAWVRAYLRSGQDPSFEGGLVSGVDGTLTVERQVGGVWSTVATIPSQNGPLTAVAAFASYNAERGNINNSLNFVVPAAIMTGLLRFTVNVAVNRVCQSASDSRSVVVDVNLQQTLNAAFITIGYTGLAADGITPLNLPAPTLAQCQAETGWTMRVYPVSGAANVRVAGTFNTNTPLNDARTAPGSCSPNWGPLLQQIAALVTADQAANPGNWVYYGIINMPANLVNVPGCNGQATGGIQGQQITYAHEIGHQFGLPHARCGNAGAGNANYPVYEPYDLPVDVPAMPIQNTNWTMASIGEYGLDINNGNIANPNNAEDFMSYCGPQWISIFTHNFLVNVPGLTPQTIQTGSGAASDRVVGDEGFGFAPPPDDVRPLIHIIGGVDAEGRVEVTSVARLETRYLVGEGTPSDLRAQLVDDDGRVLAEDTVYRYPLRGGCGGRGEPGCDDCGDEGYVLKAMLDDVAPGRSLRILRGEETVWERSRPRARPKLGSVRANLDDDGNVRISWAATRSGEAAGDSWVRWSGDGGKSWNALTIVPEGDSVEVAASLLPPGSVRFQVLAHDGFSTAAATSPAITIPESPPTVSILYPRETDRVYDERYLHLWGTASAPSREEVPSDAFVWHLDGKEVGTGADIWVDNPGLGRYELRLEVRTRAATGVATSTFEVTEAEGA
jgi:hypothetical protein